MEKLFKCKVISPIRCFGKRHEVGTIIELTQKQINAFGYPVVEKVLKSKEVVEIIPIDRMNETDMAECLRKDLDEYALDVGLTKDEIKSASNKVKIIKKIIKHREKE